MTSTATTIRTTKSAFPLWTLGHAMAVIATRQVAGMRRRRAERAELRRMTDHQLRDIGLSRGEAHAIDAGLHARASSRMAGRALKAAMKWLWTRYEHHKAMRALMALNDHELKDIGLHRSGIADAVRTGGDRTPVTATG